MNTETWLSMYNAVFGANVAVGVTVAADYELAVLTFVVAFPLSEQDGQQE
ncbi:hypothetical protein [Atopobium sp. oral taxon 199]|nr:hypothetical protein [Atopobium sp. oral taxon 199]EPD78640.1 hypothetical protein HMPREF1527_00966 [Atopobium sp. oral taxon 199 str. F0494]